MRDRVVSFRVTEEEYNFLRDRAIKSCSDISAVIRRMMHNYEVAWISPGVMTSSTNTVNASKSSYMVMNERNVNG